MTPKSPSPAVQIPSEPSDRPSWGKVGIIAVVGFAVGIAWPRLAGIRPGPSAPGEATPATAASGLRASDAPLGSVAAVTTAPAASAAANGAASNGASAVPSAASSGASAPPAVLVTHGAVISCKTQEGATLKGAGACGTVPMFDGLAQPRLKRLAFCPQASGISGKLGVVFSLDFVRMKPSFSFSRSSTVENRDSLEQCLRTAFDKVSINAVDHDHPLYAVFYSVTFTPRDSASTPIPIAGGEPTAAPTAAPASASTHAAHGSGGTGTSGAGVAAAAAPSSTAEGAAAQVAWEVAIVRDAPRTGAVVARLQRGTKVRVGAGQEGWFKVQYGAGFASEGWVYRGAIGR